MLAPLKMLVKRNSLSAKPISFCLSCRIHSLSSCLPSFTRPRWRRSEYVTGVLFPEQRKRSASDTFFLSGSLVLQKRGNKMTHGFRKWSSVCTKSQLPIVREPVGDGSISQPALTRSGLHLAMNRSISCRYRIAIKAADVQTRRQRP
jgi:hypothetical protein